MNSVGRALRAAYELLRYAIVVPLTLVANLFSPGANVPAPGRDDLENIAADELAAKLYAWAVRSVTDGLQPPISLPPEIARFATALDEREIVLLAEAGSELIASHINGNSIAGVPPIGVDPSAWRTEHAIEQYHALQRCDLWNDLSSMPAKPRPEPQMHQCSARSRVLDPDVEPAVIKFAPGV